MHTYIYVIPVLVDGHIINFLSIQQLLDLHTSLNTKSWTNSYLFIQPSK